MVRKDDGYRNTIIAPSLQFVAERRGGNLQFKAEWEKSETQMEGGGGECMDLSKEEPGIHSKIKLC